MSKKLKEKKEESREVVVYLQQILSRLADCLCRETRELTLAAWQQDDDQQAQEQYGQGMQILQLSAQQMGQFLGPSSQLQQKTSLFQKHLDNTQRQLHTLLLAGRKEDGDLLLGLMEQLV